MNRPDVTGKNTGGLPVLSGYGQAPAECKLQPFPMSSLRARKDWKSEKKSFHELETEIGSRCSQYHILGQILTTSIGPPEVQDMQLNWVEYVESVADGSRAIGAHVPIAAKSHEHMYGSLNGIGYMQSKIIED